MLSLRWWDDHCLHVIYSSPHGREANRPQPDPQDATGWGISLAGWCLPCSVGGRKINNLNRSTAPALLTCKDLTYSTLNPTPGRRVSFRLIQEALKRVIVAFEDLEVIHCQKGHGHG